MDNGQTNYTDIQNPSPDFFTAGEGSNDLNIHKNEGNLDLSGNEWSGQATQMRLQNVGNNTMNAYGGNTIEPIADRNSGQSSLRALEMPPVHDQVSGPAFLKQSSSQPKPTEIAARSIDRTAISADKFTEAGVREINKIIHLMTDDSSNGDSLANGYDMARETNIVHLSKHGSQSAWSEGEEA